MGSKVRSRRHKQLVEIQEEARSLAYRVGCMPHGSDQEPEPPPSPRVRVAVWAGIPAIAVVAALMPWWTVAPPGLVVQAFPPAPSPQVTALPPSDWSTTPTPFPPQAHIPVAPTAAPANPKPMPTPAVVQADAPTPAPTLTSPVPVPTPSPSVPPTSLPGGADPAATPVPSATPEPGGKQKCLTLLCPPKG